MTIPKPTQETCWRTSDGQSWKTEEAAQQQEFILALAKIISGHIDNTLRGVDCEAAPAQQRRRCCLLRSTSLNDRSGRSGG